jgi:hypothetical protein
MTSLRVNGVSHEIRSANLTGAMGITTLDGLGVGGGGQHTLEEHINISRCADACSPDCFQASVDREAENGGKRKRQGPGAGEH